LADQLFHIIWTTFDEYPIQDKNGSWQKTKDLYTNLKDQQTAFHLSEAFPDEYISKEPKPSRIILSGKAKNQLTTDIESLCRPGKDRIVDGLKLESVKIYDSHVELVVRCDPASVSQKISRVKSRSATLLSFAFPENYFGKNTWGKGIWVAQIFNREEQSISMIRLISQPPESDNPE
jgi:hypothetical protein